MLKKKYVVMPGVPNHEGVWQKSTHYDDWINDKVRPMFEYVDYYERHHQDPSEYDVAWDWYGPQFFAPSQCIKILDWNKPKKSSAYIAIIGSQTNITDSVVDYMVGLRKIQFAGVAKFGAPYYKGIHFDTVEEFNEYIASPDYKSRNQKAICYGVQHFAPDNKEVAQSNNYTFSFHFPDKRVGLTKLSYAQGIPNMENPVVLPYTAAPDMLSYFRWQHNGFAFLQNMVARQILANHVNNWDAFITYVLQPLPTETSIYDPFQNGLAVLLPLFILMAYIPPVYNMTFRIVREKETRAKETMRIMGMTDLPYWMSWFIFYTIINTVVSTLCWGILLRKVINYSQSGYIWLFFWLYGEAVFGQIIFLQSMFTGSKYAGIVSTIIYFCGVLVDKVIAGDGITRMSKLLASLLP